MDPTPKCYSDSRQCQRADAVFVLEKYSKQIQWRKDGRDTLLDVGTGTGDNINELILPLMPKMFRQIVGIDISKKMVDYATQHFGRENIRFEAMNFEEDIDRFRSKYPNGFDHIVSFHALHWMRSLRNALKNICKLLSPGGDCLLVFLTQMPVVRVFDDLAKRPKWKKFMSSAYNHFSTFLNREDSIGLVTNALDEAGFSEYRYELFERQLLYIGDERIKANISVFHPAVHKMNEQELNEYWADFFHLCAERDYYKEVSYGSNVKKLDTPYEMVVVYAVK